MKVDIECPKCHAPHWAIIDIFEPRLNSVQGNMFCPVYQTYFTIQGQITMKVDDEWTKKAQADHKTAIQSWEDLKRGKGGGE